MLARPFLFALRSAENLLRGFRLLGQDQLQVMPQRGFNGRDVLVRHADFVRERTENILGLL